MVLEAEVHVFDVHHERLSLHASVVVMLSQIVIEGLTIQRIPIFGRINHKIMHVRQIDNGGAPNISVPIAKLV